MNFRQYVLILLIGFYIGLPSGVKAHLQSNMSFSMWDGLPSNIVLDIFEDSRGLVWLATDAGFFEFTGGEIKFRKELSKLQGERINSISEDHEGNLWISVLGVGVCKFDGESLTVYQLDSLTPESEINCIFNDPLSKNLILGTSEGLFQLQINSNTLELVSKSNRKAVRKVRSYKNKLIISTDRQDGNFELDLNSGDIWEYSIDENRNKIELGTQENIADVQELLNLGNSFLLKEKSGKIIHCDILEVEENQNMSYYLLRYFDKGVEKRKLLKVQGVSLTDVSVEEQLEEYFIHALFLKSGHDDLWIGTQGHGLVRIQNSRFNNISPEFLGFKNPKMMDFLCDTDGNVTAASKNEIISFQGSQIQNRIVSEDFCYLCIGKSKCPKEFTIYELNFDKNGLIWISSNKGFFTLNPKNFKLKFVGITPAKNFLITADNDFLCFWNNQLRFYSKNGLNKKKPDFKFPKFSTIEISKMISKGSSVWISTRQKGIVRYQENQFQLFNRKNSKIHNVVNDILVLPDSSIIAGGNNGLIYKISNKRKNLEIVDSISNSDGLMGTSIHGIQYLSDNSLWCGTNLGVHRFEYNSWQKDSVLRFRFWNSQDGYFDQTGEKSFIDKDQNIWIQTTNSLLKLETKLKEKEITDCKINLQKIQNHNEDLILDHVYVDKWTHSPVEPVSVEHNQNYLTFYFGFSFCQNASNIRFRYMLDGYDNSWSEWSTSQKAVYPNLPSGDFTLKVEGHSLSKEVIIPFSFQISVKTPWWETWWFLTLLVFLFIGLLFIVFFSYAKIIRKQEKGRTKQFRRVIGLKMKSLQNQMNPHFIFNALNSIQSYILEENTDQALEYLSDFSMVLRKSINNANKEFIFLADEISYLQHYLKLEQMRFSDKFTYHIKVDSKINPHKYKLPPMLIQPFLENAIKYGLSGVEEKGNLSLNFDLEQDGYLKCTIIDDSIGRKKAKELHEDSTVKIHHKALHITKDRIKLLNKIVRNGRTYAYSIEDLTDENQLPRGTRVEIGFPKI